MERTPTIVLFPFIPLRNPWNPKLESSGFDLTSEFTSCPMSVYYTVHLADFTRLAHSATDRRRRGVARTTGFGALDIWYSVTV